jgi:serine protease
MRHVLPAMIVFASLLLMGYLYPALPDNPFILDRCPKPRSVSVGDVLETSARISWSASDSVIAVDLEWREAGVPGWAVVVAVQSPFTIGDLVPCADYEVRLRTHCMGSSSDYTTPVLFTADGCCRIPSGLRLDGSTPTSALITWDRVSFAFFHHVRYRATGGEEWIETGVDTNYILLTALDACTEYEVQVGSQCDLDSTEYSVSLVFQTISCGACTQQIYCVAAGDDSGSEWIDSVAFGSLRLRTGSNDGYLLRNTTQTGIERKRPYSFHVTPAATFPGAQFYLRMWIDLDQDGEFRESELLVDPADPVSVQGWTETITIPDTVPLGQTRMRIALKSVIDGDTLRPDACGNFLFGEVEDYCISIDDVCPEVQMTLAGVTQGFAQIIWPGIDASIAYVYLYRNINDLEFMDPMITQDTFIALTGLMSCSAYHVRVLNVCIQDTSSWQDLYFETECPNATREVLHLAEYLHAYPNPFDAQITLTMRPLISGQAYVRILDLMGREIRMTRVHLEEGRSTQIEFRDLRSVQHGMYLILIEAGERRQLLKMIK